MKTVLRIVSDIVSLILLILVFANFNMILHDELIPSIFEYSYVSQVENNMEPTINPKDLVIVTTNLNTLESNDIIVYHEKNDIYVSRLISVNEGTCIIKGDNEEKTKEITYSAIIAKYKDKINGASFLVSLTTKPQGLIAIAVLALVLAFFKHRKTEMF